MRALIRETEPTTIARFLSRLNFEIRDRVELLPYQDLNDLIQLCIKLEQQILRKTSSRRESSYSNSYPEEEYKGEESVSEEKPRETSKNVGKDVLPPPTRSRDVKCCKCYGRGHVQAQCSNQRTMFLKGVDEYSSHDNETSEGEEKEKENSEGAYPCEGELMMIQRSLNNQSSVNQEKQRENIFHTRCKVFENVCSLIVDSGFCCNCCSTRMVEKLNLQLIPHPKPYKHQWINEDGELAVDKQVKFELSVGNYTDKVLCDVVPMEACHILLGRPWQFAKKTMHNGLTNEITFTRKEKKFILYPLSPSQVVEDQVQMKKKRGRKNNKIENQEKTLREQKVREKSVPSHEAIEQEERIKNKFENMFLIEQPSSLLKGTHRKLLKEVNNKNLEQGRKNLEKKIMYFSLKKSCEKLPKTIEKQEEWQLNKTDFYTTAQTNSFTLFDDSQIWTFDPGGRA